MSGILMELLKNAAAAGLVVFSGVNKLIPSPNPVMNWVKIGTTQIVAEDMVQYLNGGGSLILNLDYKNVFDRIVFASGFAYGLTSAGVTSKLVTMLDEISPLPENFNDAIVDGSLIMLNRTTADLMDSSSYFSQVPFVYLNHLSHLITG